MAMTIHEKRESCTDCGGLFEPDDLQETVDGERLCFGCFEALQEPPVLYN